MEQPKITGYRQLNETEAALMNEIKAHGTALEALIDKVVAHVDQQYADAIDADESDRMDRADPMTWADTARTQLQLGLMALTRAVAQPSSF